MVLNNDPKLKKNFNCNSYTLLYNKINRCKYMVNAKVYYTFDRNKEDLLKRFLNFESTSQRTYFFDGEYIFINLQVFNLKSKIQATKFIFS